MPYKTVDPWPHKIMMSDRYVNRNTICGRLRKLYQTIEDENIRHELAICMTMAKKMHKRLQYYKEKEVNQNDN